MVAKITSPHSVKRALNYNEQKVQKGMATCIYAGNYLRDADHLNFYQKLNRFQVLITLNDRSKRSNTMHISLNFDPSEKLSRNMLVSIAETYINKIGFGRQPFLVYEHTDAGHPHIHILTTNIESTGRRIDTFNIGRLKSEPTRKEIEIQFGLIKADNKRRATAGTTEDMRFEYGKSQTKRAITNVLDRVINHYNYRSLATLNAILQTFRITADRGSKTGRIYKHRGLLYHILDQAGKKIGVPIKASSIYSMPTLSNLEKKFVENKRARSLNRQKLKATMDRELLNKPKNLDALIRSLEKQDIQSQLRKNEQGFIYGITFVDHGNKLVYNGSELGKEYSIRALQTRLGESLPKDKMQRNAPEDKLDVNHIHASGAIKKLLQAEEADNKMLSELMPKRRRKKSRLNL